MTRKDYQIIATAIAQAYAESSSEGQQKGVEKTMEHIVHALQLDNSRFDPGRFVQYVKKLLK